MGAEAASREERGRRAYGVDAGSRRTSPRPSMPSMRKTARLECEPTHYLNVDLDIVSSVPLDDLVHAMGEGALVLYVGGARRKYKAHIELECSHRMSADETIVGLVRLVQSLPPRYKKVWDAAKAREFNIGIQAGLEPHSFELHLDRRTLDAISDVRGTLAVTVYAPDLHDTKPRERRGPPRR